MEGLTQEFALTVVTKVLEGGGNWVWLAFRKLHYKVLEIKRQTKILQTVLDDNIDDIKRSAVGTCGHRA